MKLTPTIAALAFSAAIAAPAAAQTCALAPLPGCKLAERSALSLRNEADDTKDRLNWKWGKGEPTSLANFADPTAATTYKLCLYSAGALRTGGQAIIDPSSVNWLPTPAGYKFKDKTGANDGITGAGMKSDGEPSRSSARAKGAGANLPDPTLPMTMADFPLVVQFVNHDSNFCVESTFLQVDIVKNEPTKFKIKNQ